MLGRPNGSIIGATQEPTPTSAGGIWTLPAQLELQKQGKWIAPGYNISRSLRFDSARSNYLSRTPASAGNRRTWTWSGWVKRSVLGTNQWIFVARGASSPQFNIGFNQGSDNSILRITGDTATATDLRTSQLFRDVSSWFHLVVSTDTTQATASNRIKVYVNGQQVTDFSQANYPGQNDDTNVNATVQHNISGQAIFGEYFNGYLTEVHFIDGQALDPSYFGVIDNLTGIWRPKQVEDMNYGTNGFYLPFSDNTSTITLGYDQSGNANNWTLSAGFSVAAGANNDSLVDTPTQYGTDTGAGGEVRGNYATFNALNTKLGAGSLTNGNLTFTGPSGSAVYNFTGGTFGIDTSTSVGWYFEVTQTTYGQYAGVSLLDSSVSASALDTAYGIGSTANSSAGINYRNDGVISNYGTDTSGFTTWTSSSDVISIAIKDNKIWFAKNGTWISGDPAAGTSPSITLASAKTVTPAAIGINSNVFDLNAGQRPFAYTAPSGFKALCTTNLPDPTVLQGDDHFNTVLYTGNGTTQSITGVGFQPDFVWIKVRSTADNHKLTDAVRGATKTLFSNTTDNEFTEGNALTSFDADGFSLGSESGSNGSGKTFVAWNWKANGAGSLNELGSIPSTVSANQTAGISIVTYTGNGTAGATVGHGLGVAPKMVIVKKRNTSGGFWIVYHQTVGNTTALALNDTSASYTPSTGYWNNTSPSSTVFTVGTGSGVNTLNDTYVAYCFAEVEGFSKFGSYTGNGSADGPFVYTGFRPRWIMYKPSNVALTDWVMWDTVRNPYNIASNYLLANTSGAEGSVGVVDILSNGFKLRVTSTGNNASGDQIVYAAFAENPFKNALAR